MLSRDYGSLSVEPADVIKGAVGAEGLFAADILTEVYEQGMVFIEESGIRRQIVHKKALEGGVTIAGRGNADAAGNAACVGINDEGRLIGSIEYYRIGGLFADAVDGKKLLAKVGDVASKQLIEVVVVVFLQPLCKSLELQCFGVIVATGADKPCQFGLAEPAQRSGR